MKEQILIGPSSFASLDKAPLERLLEEGYEVVNNPYGRKYSRDELLALLPGVTGLIAGLEPLDKSVLEVSGLKVVSRVGSGMSNVDQDAAKKMGIKVFNTPDGPTASVAELTVGVMLNLIRMVPQMDKALHEGKWTKKIGFQLSEKTVAIIGFGKIGQYIAALLKPFGTKVVAVDPYWSGMVGDVPILLLEEALSQADIITLHISGEGEVLGEKEFKQIKKGTFILNCSRGGVVNETFLQQALDDETVAGAWLDTFINEPYSDAFTKYPQVVLTPHIGSYTLECRRGMEMEAVENLIHGLK